MPLPDHTLSLCCKDLPQLRSLDIYWPSSEAVLFGDALVGLTPLKTLDLTLRDFSGLQQLPPYVTSLRLCAMQLLDMATAPCLQSCSGLHSLNIDAYAGVHKYAVALSAQAI